MKQQAYSLLQDLEDLTQSMIDRAEKYRGMPAEVLNARPAPDAWSVLECLEHLNLYGDFYLVEIDNRINAASKFSKDHTFSSGWLGNYSAESMLPRPGKPLKKMKTFRSKDPIGSDLSKTVIDRFIKQQQRMLGLLKNSRNVNLNKVRVPTTLGRLIKFRLGDIFRFVIYHNQRHVLQAERVLGEKVGVSERVKGNG